MAQQTNILGHLADFSAILNRMANEKTEKETEKLNNNIENLNKTILKLAQQSVPALGSGSSIAAIANQRKSYNTFGENLRAKFVSPIKEKFGSTRGIANTLGLVSKGSGSLLDRMMEKREDRNQFIEDQLRVNPNMENTAANRKIFAKKFDSQNKIQKELGKTQAEIDRLQSAGFSEKQIAKTGLVKQRDQQAAQLIAADNRLYEKAKIGSGVEKQTKENTSNISEEETAEDNKVQQASSDSLKTIATDVAEVRRIMEGNNEQNLDTEPKEKDSSWFDGIFGGLAAYLLAKFTGIGKILGDGVTSAFNIVKGMLGSLWDMAKSAGGKIFDFAKGVGGKAADVGKAAADKVKTFGKEVLTKAKNIIKSPKALSGGIADLAIGAAPLALMYGATQMAGDTSKDVERSKNLVSFSDKLRGWMGVKSDEEVQREWRAKKDAELGIVTKPIEKTGKEQIVTKTLENVEAKTAEAKEAKKEASKNVVVSAPTTVNNNTSRTNNIMKLSPRNPEQSFNKVVLNRYSR